MSVALGLSQLRLGALGACVSVPAGYAAKRAIQRLLCNLVGQCSYIESISGGLLCGLLKATISVNAILLMPPVEEWLLRGVAYEKMEQFQEAVVDGFSSEGFKSNSWASRSIRVITSAVMFGMYHGIGVGTFHMDYLAGWQDVPRIVVHIVTGLVFAILREMTGSWWVPAIAHSLNNAVVLMSGL